MYICRRKAKPNFIHIGIIRRPGGFESEGTEWEGAQTEIKKITKIGYKELNQLIAKIIS